MPEKRIIIAEQFEEGAQTKRAERNVFSLETKSRSSAGEEEQREASGNIATRMNRKPLMRLRRFRSHSISQSLLKVFELKGSLFRRNAAERERTYATLQRFVAFHRPETEQIVANIHFQHRRFVRLERRKNDRSVVRFGGENLPMVASRARRPVLDCRRSFCPSSFDLSTRCERSFFSRRFWASSHRN